MSQDSTMVMIMSMASPHTKLTWQKTSEPIWISRAGWDQVSDPHNVATVAGSSQVAHGMLYPDLNFLLNCEYYFMSK